MNSIRQFPGAELQKASYLENRDIQPPFNYPVTNDKEVIMKHSLARQLYISLLLIILSVIFSAQTHAISASASTVQAGDSYSVTYTPRSLLQERVGATIIWTFVTGTNGVAEFSNKPEGIYYYRGVTINFGSGFQFNYSYSNEISVTVYSGPPHPS